jgi:site-specific recombinase XerD
MRNRQRDIELARKWICSFSRSTAWRYLKAVTAAVGITGTPAMPKGLRHGFGVDAFQSNVPPHLVQCWLGHASLRTTAIYGNDRPGRTCDCGAHVGEEVKRSYSTP